ncbi:MAG: hypothetical protein ACKOC5_16445 [Chloroflexota bacterium]
MMRWIRFLLAILVGAAAGLAYGWLISPVRYVDTSPDTLRIDYKTDYVLMVAEAYAAEQDLPAAVRRLALLGAASPDEQLGRAIEFAAQNGYNAADVQRLQDLLAALQTFNLGRGTPAP